MLVLFVCDLYEFIIAKSENLVNAKNSRFLSCFEKILFFLLIGIFRGALFVALQKNSKIKGEFFRKLLTEKKNCDTIKNPPPLSLLSGLKKPQKNFLKKLKKGIDKEKKVWYNSQAVREAGRKVIEN